MLLTDSLKERFESKYIPEPMSGCWLWLDKLTRDGYGQMTYKMKSMRAHRWSYSIHVGPIPNGLLVCHKCDTPACVNPKHLFVGTVKDNTEDMIKKGRGLNNKPTCKYGHQLSGNNLLNTKRVGVTGFKWRYCKLCNQRKNKQARLRKLGRPK